MTTWTDAQIDEAWEIASNHGWTLGRFIGLLHSAVVTETAYEQPRDHVLGRIPLGEFSNDEWARYFA